MRTLTQIESTTISGATPAYVYTDLGWTYGIYTGAGFGVGVGLTLGITQGSTAAALMGGALMGLACAPIFMVGGMIIGAAYGNKYGTYFV